MSVQNLRLSLEFDFEVNVCKRIIVVPSNITFDDFHTMIQAMNNWLNCHLYNFEIGTGKSSYIAEPKWQTDDLDIFNDLDEREVVDSSTLTLDSVFPQKKTVLYHYDYGDGWEIKIQYLETVEAPALKVPYCATGVGACPPEDVGGEIGFEEYLRIFNDAEDEEHESMVEWGTDQGFELFNVDSCNKRLAEYEEFRANV